MDIGQGVVAHFYLGKRIKNAYSPKGVQVELVAVGNEQNKAWAESTPQGNLTMTIKNEVAAELFTDDDIGCEFELRIVKIPKAVSPAS